MYQKFFKRPIDFCISLCALIILCPVLLIIAIWLHFANKRAGAFFYQERIGRNGKPYKIIKFRSMTDERDANAKLLPDAQRLTKVGRFLRITSIDELPQLINILKGDMALIGPRPLLPEYLWVFDEIQIRRQDVRPGITGWAQVNGRNRCKLSKKFELDVWYVDHCSLITDIKIIFLTINNVLLHEDIGEGAGDMKDIDDLNMSARIKAIREQKKAEDEAKANGSLLKG